MGAHLPHNAEQAEGIPSDAKARNELTECVAWPASVVRQDILEKLGAIGRRRLVRRMGISPNSAHCILSGLSATVTLHTADRVYLALGKHPDWSVAVPARGARCNAERMVERGFAGDATVDDLMERYERLCVVDERYVEFRSRERTRRAPLAATA